MRRFTEQLRQSAREERARPPLCYTPQLDQLPRHLVDRFEQLSCDAATRSFLAQAKQGSVARAFAAELLSCCGGRFVSRTAANGLLHRGGMFVLSTQQARRLLRRHDDDDDDAASAANTATAAAAHDDSATTTTMSHAPLYDSLLDLGAGDGGVTAQLAPLFARVTVTETSSVMRWRLRRRGFAVRAVDDNGNNDNNNGDDKPASSWWWWPWQQGTAEATTATPAPSPRPCYDVVSCLNVLDRADAPWSLLREARALLQPDGLLLLAVVLPWCPFVERGATRHAPRETLPMTGGECCRGATYEASLTTLVQKVLLPCGFDVVRWTMLPYLCEGNLHTEYCVLRDAVLVLQRSKLPPDNDNDDSSATASTRSAPV